MPWKGIEKAAGGCAAAPLAPGEGRMTGKPWNNGRFWRTRIPICRRFRACAPSSLTGGRAAMRLAPGYFGARLGERTGREKQKENHVAESTD